MEVDIVSIEYESIKKSCLIFFILLEAQLKTSQSW